MEAYAKTNYPGIQPANPIENARPLLTPLQRRTWEQMQQVIGWIESYMNDHGAYPTTAQGLAVLSTYGTVPAADPWGNAYVYRSPGRVNDYDLVSLGADGAEGGTGENADIVSWAEASLIGQWYEYTPTSALDIAFNEILPSA
ncbi:MAG: type II secretion system protein GspG [Gammaproteobacteria bacterium]|nr:type II secretion system protein GspG [Gammaproteobacteria bacterium]